MNTLVQVLVGLAICVLVLILTLWVYSRDTIRAIRAQRNAFKPRASVDFVWAIADAAGDGRNQKVAQDEIPFAINQKGGAEMTYNFWLYKDSASNIYGRVEAPRVNDKIYSVGARNLEATNENMTSDAGLHIHDIPILLKGERQVVRYATQCSTTKAPRYKQDVLVKCPLIKFDRGTDRITVQFNTYGSPDAVEESTTWRTCTDNGAASWLRKTAHQFSVSGLDDPNYTNKWFMVTVVLSDTVPSGMYPLRNKVNCKVFINGVKMVDKFADGRIGDPVNKYSVLRQNRSPLWVFPHMKGLAPQNRSTFSVENRKMLQMAGGRYFNYALSDEDIYILYKNRFDIKPTRTITILDDIPEFSKREETEKMVTNRV